MLVYTLRALKARKYRLWIRAMEARSSAERGSNVMRGLSAFLLSLLLATAAACGSAPAAAPQNSESQLAFGVSMAQRQLWNEALFRFRQAARQEPSNPKVYNNLAVACEATGNFEEALENYQKALRLAPTDRDLKANYTRFVEFYQSFKPKESEESDGGNG